ncbi:MAG: hypothetical protein FJ100_01610 [Deltaproteobacteria bacterium]|nr:hypothetical protein [Deltaproteobacteria bacterium]
MPRTAIAIHILDDGRVVFGDLPPDLAEVAALLDPSRQTGPASVTIPNRAPGPDVEATPGPTGPPDPTDPA